MSFLSKYVKKNKIDNCQKPSYPFADILPGGISCLFGAFKCFHTGNQPRMSVSVQDLIILSEVTLDDFHIARDQIINPCNADGSLIVQPSFLNGGIISQLATKITEFGKSGSIQLDKVTAWIIPTEKMIGNKSTIRLESVIGHMEISDVASAVIIPEIMDGRHNLQ